MKGLSSRLFLTVIMSLFAFSVFAQKRIISPVEGTFNNRQMLIIDQNDGAECYFTATGSDPLTSGFIYDGPVLIESTGQVKLNIVCIKGDMREEYEVDFTVNDNSRELASKESQNDLEYFVGSVVSAGIYSLSSDNPLSIPANLSFAIGDGDTPFIPGSLLTLDRQNSLTRYLPCIVTDGTSKWRFIIHVTSDLNGVFSKYDVPFAVSDWENFSFVGEKLIYSLDDGEWSASKDVIKLDRSVPHTVRWQSVAYDAANPIQSFVLPPKPVLETTANKRNGGFYTFSIQGDSRYKMELRSSGTYGQDKESKGLFSKIVFDTLIGDQISGQAEFALYCDGVFQGTLTGSYDIDRQPPLPPTFSSGVKGFYARSSVNLQISASSEEELFYAVSDPYLVPQQELEQGQMDFSDIQPKAFKKYTKPIRLIAGKQGAVYYCVRAYSVDKANNISEISSYSVIIDQYNYYIDSNSKSELSDGTRTNPFTTFEQAVNVINNTRFAHFYITGTLQIPAGENIITSNCSFTSQEGARLLFAPDSSLLIRSAGFEAQNIVFEKEKIVSQESTAAMFTFENSTANFKDCEIVALFKENGTVITARNTAVNLLNTGLTVQADVYACGISGAQSKLNIKGSRITSIAPTSINLSVMAGSLELRTSDCKVMAHLGRIAELTATSARISGNSFIGEFDRQVKNLDPVWYDDSTKIQENKNNKQEGF